MENKKVVYVAELDEDIDDVVAVEYLFRKKALDCVVLDPYPKTTDGIERLNKIKNKGIKTTKEIPYGTKYIFVGGALTKVSEYVKSNRIDLLVMNGGFVGYNIETRFTLPKFRSKKAVRTFNFNCDVLSTDKVLKSANIKEIILIGKNVCHNRKNTLKGIWKKEKELLEEYNVNENKLQHDMLACHEGLAYMGIIKEKMFIELEELQPFNLGLDGIYTKWGSDYPNRISPYRVCKVAVDWNL